MAAGREKDRRCNVKSTEVYCSKQWTYTWISARRKLLSQTKSAGISVINRTPGLGRWGLQDHDQLTYRVDNSSVPTALGQNRLPHQSQGGSDQHPVLAGRWTGARAWL
nr:hypothetical protein CFP56_57052 [Quercus suber]